MTAWPAADLEARLIRALHLATGVVSDFAETGYTDAGTPQLSFGPEKVVAEAAMLAYGATHASDRAAVRCRIESLGLQLVPHVRSRRAVVDMALQPGHAYKHAVPHVLLTSLGFVDDDFDEVFRSRCAIADELANDLPPSAHFERLWITELWNHNARSGLEDDLRGTFLDRPMDVLSDSREDAYVLTHVLFYLSDFGRASSPMSSRDVATVLDEVEVLLLRYLDLEDYDLCGELLMAWPQLGARWSPAAAFAVRVLARVEDEAGLLPCGNVDTERLSGLDGDERRRYARATAYDTAFVMGFLCAVSLRHGTAPPTTIAGRQYPDAVWEGFLGYIDDSQGHWLEIFRECDDAEKRVLAPLLCHIAIIQRLRQRDYKSVHGVLVRARVGQMSDHPLLTRAGEVLTALRTAMSMFDQR